MSIRVLFWQENQNTFLSKPSQRYSTEGNIYKNKFSWLFIRRWSSKGVQSFAYTLQGLRLSLFFFTIICVTPCLISLPSMFFSPSTHFPFTFVVVVAVCPSWPLTSRSTFWKRMGKAFMLPHPFADCITWEGDVMAGGRGGDGVDNVDYVAPPLTLLSQTMHYHHSLLATLPPYLPLSLSLSLIPLLCLSSSLSPCCCPTGDDGGLEHEGRRVGSAASVFPASRGSRLIEGVLTWRRGPPLGDNKSLGYKNQQTNQLECN